MRNIKITGLLLSLALLYSCEQKQQEVTIANAPPADNIITHVDGKEEPAKETMERHNNDEIYPINWSNGTRDALLRFGGKYSNGLMIFKTR